MARYRTYTIAFKRQLVEEHLSGGAGLSELARRHDLSRELLRTWAKKHEAGELADGRPVTPDRRADEAKIAGLERKVGQLTMELDLLKRGLISARRARGASGSVALGDRRVLPRLPASRGGRRGTGAATIFSASFPCLRHRASPSRPSKGEKAQAVASVPGRALERQAAS